MSDINDALLECVRACAPEPGAKGSKIVGPILWPEKDPLQAQRLLADCLNTQNDRHLTPEQAVLVMRLARAKGCHEGIEALARELGYAQPVPITPRDEQAELQRQFIESTRLQAELVERMERLQRGD